MGLQRKDEVCYRICVRELVAVGGLFTVRIALPDNLYRHSELVEESLRYTRLRSLTLTPLGMT